MTHQACLKDKVLDDLKFLKSGKNEVIVLSYFQAELL